MLMLMLIKTSLITRKVHNENELHYSVLKSLLSVIRFWNQQKFLVYTQLSSKTLFLNI